MRRKIHRPDCPRVRGDLRLLAWFLHHANAAQPEDCREAFYRIKDRILSAYGTPDGRDVQHIRKACWGDRGEPCNEECCRCGGTGIFQEKWVVLQRYRLDRYTFHRPVETYFSRQPDGVEATIEGLIRHHAFPELAREAIGVLLWRYDPEAFNSWLSAGHWQTPKLRLLGRLASRQLPALQEGQGERREASVLELVQ